MAGWVNFYLVLYQAFKVHKFPWITVQMLCVSTHTLHSIRRNSHCLVLQAFMEEMTRKQPDVDKITKTHKRKAALEPQIHSQIPVLDKGRAGSMYPTTQPSKAQLGTIWEVMSHRTVTQHPHCVYFGTWSDVITDLSHGAKTLSIHFFFFVFRVQENVLPLKPCMRQ